MGVRERGIKVDSSVFGLSHLRMGLSLTEVERKLKEGQVGRKSGCSHSDLWVRGLYAPKRDDREAAI